jgi:hypothetical protein
MPSWADALRDDYKVVQSPWYNKKKAVDVGIANNKIAMSSMQDDFMKPQRTPIGGAIDALRNKGIDNTPMRVADTLLGQSSNMDLLDPSHGAGRMAAPMMAGPIENVIRRLGNYDVTNRIPDRLLSVDTNLGLTDTFGKLFGNPNGYPNRSFRATMDDNTIKRATGNLHDREVSGGITAPDMIPSQIREMVRQTYRGMENVPQLSNVDHMRRISLGEWPFDPKMLEGGSPPLGLFGFDNPTNPKSQMYFNTNRQASGMHPNERSRFAEEDVLIDPYTGYDSAAHESGHALHFTYPELFAPYMREFWKEPKAGMFDDYTGTSEWARSLKGLSRPVPEQMKHSPYEQAVSSYGTYSPMEDVADTFSLIHQLRNPYIDPFWGNSNDHQKALGQITKHLTADGKIGSDRFNMMDDIYSLLRKGRQQMPQYWNSWMANNPTKTP